MKLKKEHDHKEADLNQADNLIHKKTKSIPVKNEPMDLHSRPGGFFGRKWFNHVSKGK